MAHVPPNATLLPDRSAPTRIVVAAREASRGQLAYRGAVAIAARPWNQAFMVLGAHGGLNGNERDPSSDPEAFAATLRASLDTQPL